MNQTPSGLMLVSEEEVALSWWDEGEEKRVFNIRVFTDKDAQGRTLKYIEAEQDGNEENRIFLQDFEWKALISTIEDVLKESK